MILSHKNKFIFLKTRKTAGTSIEIALSQFCGDEDIITPISPPDEALRAKLGYRGCQNYLDPRTKEKRFRNHICATKVRDFIGEEIWQKYYKFCFERNPWDKVISFYYYHNKSEPRPSLGEFIFSEKVNVASNYDLYSIDGKIAVDYIGRFENLEQDLEFVCQCLHLPKLELPQAKTGFRKDRRHYRQVLNAEQRMKIADIFSKEIAYFNYQF